MKISIFVSKLISNKTINKNLIVWRNRENSD
uniref:Uncharacterized protein n=1 Tax=Siphoviridae sp. ctJ3t72 TaxID=2826240 RepID=A0A8S5QNP9_9CAUD|nr:MAG TPA: hypothetical protein [Siphoviridae sp. ctJ3t72]